MYVTFFCFGTGIESEERTDDLLGRPIRPLSAIELLVDGGGVGMDPPDTAD